MRQPPQVPHIDLRIHFYSDLGTHSVHCKVHCVDHMDSYHTAALVEAEYFLGCTDAAVVGVRFVERIEQIALAPVDVEGVADQRLSKKDLVGLWVAVADSIAVDVAVPVVAFAAETKIPVVAR